jgi:DNA polymerase III delta subunit
MHSKLLPWDFIQKYPQTIVQDTYGVSAFLSSDPYLERILSHHLPKQEKNFCCYSGSDITRDFIEEHFCNLSFFSQNENIYVLNAELIPSQNSVLFIEKIIEISNQHVVLFFSKSNKLFLELHKHPGVRAVTIEPPRFWEGQKILQLVMKEKKMQLNGDVTRFLLENIEHTFESIYRALDSIQVTFSDGNIDFSQLKFLIIRERFDFFELLDVYYQNPKKLYEIILSNELDFDWLRGLASFMQGHFAKILFPIEIQLKDKAKLSKYDQGILFQHERLNLENLKKDLRFFADLEILAKSRDQLILNHFRRKIIE